MKILPVDKIREADAYTILHEPVADIDLMERAATACTGWIEAHIPASNKILIFCGTGNNGGDGMAIARMLIAKGYAVEAFIAGKKEKFSDNSRINFGRLKKLIGPAVSFLEEDSKLPRINSSGNVVIDALFGSGLDRAIEGFPAKLIHHINSSRAKVVAIDIPSGLFCDATVKQLKQPAIIKAQHTLTFSPPKLCFFFPENYPYSGEFHLLDIGIMQEFIDNADTKNYLTSEEDILKIYRPRTKFAHKGNFGHALLICGGRGKMGAAVLASRGCLRAGAGLVTAHVPQSGTPILQGAVPETMLDPDSDPDILTELQDLSRFNAIGIGPGIGTEKQTQNTLKLLIQNAHVPLVIDADAINILGENKTWISFVPKGSIFTPHPKEFERIAGKTSDDFERNRLQREFSVKHRIYVVLKGAHTAITTPDGKCWFNSTGNPGMATGGSGDVLTGMITGLIAQGYTPFEAAQMGVWLHGLAGDIASEELGHEAMIAGDIIGNIGKAYLSLYGKL